MEKWKSGEIGNRMLLVDKDCTEIKIEVYTGNRLTNTTIEQFITPNNEKGLSDPKKVSIETSNGTVWCVESVDR